MSEEPASQGENRLLQGKQHNDASPTGVHATARRSGGEPIALEALIRDPITAEGRDEGVKGTAAVDHECPMKMYECVMM